jgi:phosphoserine phosphatase RsbU/P
VQTERADESTTAFAREAAEAYPGLADILARIHAGMRADTATVLLLDDTRTVLTPAATIGLDRTLRGALAVPVGQGFAGKVAQSRQPVVIGEVSRSTVLNPVLIDHGVRSLLGVPIIDGSELLGVVHVGFLRHHDFDGAEQLQLTGYAQELGEVLRLRFSDTDHTTALTLQRSLLPARPRAPRGLALAARYVPADGDLGGDWYDVFELPDGRLGLVMGDVAGHGLGAAIVMGRLRSALRSYALEHADPAEVLRRLDRKICHFEPDALATVLFGVSEAPYERWTFSCAGHPAPLLGLPGRPAVPVQLDIDPLLGMDPEANRHATDVVLPAGGQLCLYTDGLVERRPGPEDADRDIVADNVRRLGEALASAADPETACIKALTEVVGQDTTDDDVAVLIARRDAGTDVPGPPAPRVG